MFSTNSSGPVGESAVVVLSIPPPPSSEILQDADKPLTMRLDSIFTAAAASRSSCSSTTEASSSLVEVRATRRPAGAMPPWPRLISSCQRTQDKSLDDELLTIAPPRFSIAISTTATVLLFILFRIRGSTAHYRALMSLQQTTTAALVPPGSDRKYMFSLPVGAWHSSLSEAYITPARGDNETNCEGRNCVNYLSSHDMEDKRSLLPHQHRGAESGHEFSTFLFADDGTHADAPARGSEGATDTPSSPPLRMTGGSAAGSERGLAKLTWAAAPLTAAAGEADAAAAAAGRLRAGFQQPAAAPNGGGPLRATAGWARKNGARLQRHGEAVDVSDTVAVCTAAAPPPGGHVTARGAVAFGDNESEP